MTAVKPAARQLPLRVDSSQSSRVPSVRFGTSALAAGFRGGAGLLSRLRLRPWVLAGFDPQWLDLNFTVAGFHFRNISIPL
jgi:hypothetical protein